MPVYELNLPSKECRTIYIALQPNLVIVPRKSEAFTPIICDSKIESQEQQLSKSNDVRELIGGIKVLVYLKYTPVDPPNGMVMKVTPNSSGMLHLITQTFKFTATIGQSIFSLSTEVIDLGTCIKPGEILSNGFWIQNISTRLPLDVKICCSDPFIKLECHSANVDSVILNSDTLDNINTRMYIGFSFHAPLNGFISGKIECINQNSSQILSILVRGFIDPNILDLSPTLKSKKDINQILSWDNVYIVPDGGETSRPLSVSLQKNIALNAIPDNEISIEIHNLGDELLHIQPISDLDIFVRWKLVNSTCFVIDGRQINSPTNKSTINSSLQKLFSACGSAIMLPARAKIIAVVSVPKPCPLVDEKSISTLLSGKKIEINGILLLESVEKGDILKVNQLFATYGMSKGLIEPKLVDFGKVGHVTGWSDCKFTFFIENQSEIPLIYEVDVPPWIEILPSSVTSESLHSKRRLNPKSCESVDAVFRPRKATARKSGGQNFEIRAINIFNPMNELVINAKYFMTESELRFDKLVSGELILPPLTHPASSNDLPCDNWFTVTNISDDDVKFDVGCQLSPDVSSLVGMEILSRLNTPIASSILLGPKASTEIKVRAVPIETARLYSKDPRTSYLTNPDGVTLGTVWISSKNLNTDLSDIESRFTENITLRGSLKEGQCFSLSRNRIEFHSIVQSDSSFPENVNRLLKHDLKQCEEILVTNLSPVFPLEFKLSFEYPIEFSSTGDKIFDISGVEEDMTGLVKPGSILSLKLTLRNSSIGEISQDIKLNFYDRNAFSKSIQTISISIKEDNNATLPTVTPNSPILEPKTIETRSLESGQHIHDEGDLGRGSFHLGSFDPKNIFLTEEEGLFLSPPLERRYSETSISTPNSFFGKSSIPAIILKGCKKMIDSVTNVFNGLYDLDLGQQDLNPNPLIRKLSLENISSVKLPYKIKILNDLGRSWIVCNRYEGVLDPNRQSNTANPQSYHTICLNFMLSIRGIWSTYLIVENIDNPADIHIIRVHLEVVAKQNIKRSTLPSTALNSAFLLESGSNNRVFDVTTSGISGRDTSFNLGDICLDTFHKSRCFVIHNYDSVPLEFSVKSNLPPESDMELIFSLVRSSPKLFKNVTVEAESQRKIYLYFWPGRNNGSVKLEAVREVNLEIYVNCRLVKDYQMM